MEQAEIILETVDGQGKEIVRRWFFTLVRQLLHPLITPKPQEGRNPLKNLV